eukprot:92389-Amphidinium_carterae.1
MEALSRADTCDSCACWPRCCLCPHGLRLAARWAKQQAVTDMRELQDGAKLATLCGKGRERVAVELRVLKDAL